MKKKIMLVLLTIVMCMTVAFTAVACSQPKESDTLKIGYTLYAPIAYKDATNNDKLIGFDIEFAEAVAEKIGKKVEFVEIEWSNKVMDINSGKIDCLWNGMTISDSLKTSINISNPYMVNKQTAIVKKDSTIANQADMKGKKIGAENGSAGQTVIEENQLGELKTVTAQLDLFMEMATGKIDVAVMDNVMAGYYLTMPEYSDYKMIELDVEEEYFGIGFLKSETKTYLQSAVELAIEVLKNDGTLKTIATKYGLESALVK